jgi:gamma-glutamyltranspeptidase/glutathione hydrolase
VEVIPPQAYLHAILDLILRHDEDGREIYGPRGAALLAGERLVMTDLAETLEVLARAGASAFYEGELGQALVGHVRGHGGTITLDDLRSYRVIRRRPIRVPSGGHVFVTNPPPSSGGALIGYGLLLLDQAGPGGPPGSAEAMARLVEVMREQNRARREAFAAELFRGGLTRRLYAPNVVAEAAGRLGNTTHISVVDERGNAASMTASTGSGAGVVVPATGIHLNNMLGEYDLSPEGARTQAGRRLTSMMAPSLVLRDGRPRLVVGSAGSVRLRGAILQIVVNVVLHGQPVDEAIARPRVHLEEPHVHCEGGADPAELDRLAAMGYELVRWRRHNLYFGGASGVEFRDDGTLAAAGDPRRGGHGVVVE